MVISFFGGYIIQNKKKSTSFHEFCRITLGWEIFRNIKADNSLFQTTFRNQGDLFLDSTNS